MPKSLDARVIVVGGGPAGLAAAALLGLEGVPTLHLALESTEDPRTVALMEPSLRLLKRIGLWPGALTEVSAPLRHLDIIDELGNLVAAPRLTFSASEVGLDSFGWNVPLLDLILALRARVAALGVAIMPETVTQSTDEGDFVQVTTLNGKNYSAQVLIAADGADSILRKCAGIDVEHWSFDQMALVTSFSHSGPHSDVSTERHKPGGPFTTVPLPGRRSSLVWMAKPPLIESLMTRKAKELATEIQLATHGTLGLIGDIAAHRSFPMRGLRAHRFAGARTLLVGEAAHAFPPIGAQGLNMSMRDVAHAVDCIMAEEDAGAARVLQNYHAARAGDVAQRQMAITMMNKSLLADLLPLDLMRVGALSLIAAFPPLRQLVIREGLAPTGNMPFSMRTL